MTHDEKNRNALCVPMFSKAFIDEVRQDAAPIGCDFRRGIAEDLAFADMYHSSPLNPWQLVQIIGARVHVSHLAAHLLAEFHLPTN